MKQILLYFTFLLTITNLSFAQTYHEDDKEGLRMFLRQPSAIAGEINAQRLGLQISDTLNWQTQEEWVTKISGIAWNNETLKRLIEISWSQRSIAGNLNCSKWIYLSGYLICSINQLSSLQVENCQNLTLISCSYNDSLKNIYVSNCSALTHFRCERNQLSTLKTFNSPSLKYLECNDNQLITMCISNCMDLNCKNNLFSTLSLNIANLLILECSNNSIKTINLSANTSLQKLAINNNQLVSLDVSNNPALNELNCNNNELTSIDLSNNAFLVQLECRNNQLSTLDVNKATYLSSLDCRNNQLTSLDISHNKKLQNLYCDKNELTMLNLNNATTLSELTCTNNQLLALDFKDCVSLRDVNCSNNNLTSITNINNKSSLEELNCDNNQLTTLDVSNCTGLVELSCVNNQLTTLDVSNCKSIIHIDCRHNLLRALDISTVGIYLHALWCNHNQMFFSGIPPTIPYPWEYEYWPQNTIDGGKIHYETGIDLSKEYMVEGDFTQFSWFDITNGEEQPIELPNEYGFFSLTEEFVGKRLRCKMLNATFPWLSGNNILIYEVNITDEVGIEPITNYELRITVYPNPTSGQLRITNYELRIESVEIFDVYGRTVGAKFPSNELEGWQPQADGVVLNISHLNSGIYFVKITTDQGTITKKIIIN